jgi:biotin carboxyl carrier protein
VDDRSQAIPELPDEQPSLARLAEEVLPALIARLDVSELGELEVRHDGWRVRLRRSVAAPRAAEPAPTASGEPATAATPTHDGTRRVATSPAVGYYSPNDRAAVGRQVTSGDVLGWVDVLGVRQEVVAPTAGVVGRLLAEPGQAVEFGQELLVIDLPRRATGRDGEPSDGPGEPGGGAAPAEPPVAD